MVGGFLFDQFFLYVTIIVFIYKITKLSRVSIRERPNDAPTTDLRLFSTSFGRQAPQKGLPPVASRETRDEETVPSPTAHLSVGER